MRDSVICGGCKRKVNIRKPDNLIDDLEIGFNIDSEIKESMIYDYVVLECKNCGNKIRLPYMKKESDDIG